MRCVLYVPVIVIVLVTPVGHVMSCHVMSCQQFRCFSVVMLTVPLLFLLWSTVLLQLVLLSLLLPAICDPRPALSPPPSAQSVVLVFLCCGLVVPIRYDAVCLSPCVPLCPSVSLLISMCCAPLLVSDDSSRLAVLSGVEHLPSREHCTPPWRMHGTPVPRLPPNAEQQVGAAPRRPSPSLAFILGGDPGLVCVCHVLCVFW